MTGIVTTGVVAFSNLDEMESYQGQSTGRYSLVIRLDDVAASALADMGIKLREYEGVAQRKFASKYKVDVLDLAGNPVPGEIPYGSKVRVLWKAGDAHPVHGVSTYLNKVRIVELADNDDGDYVPDEF
jgi:hypothetical protein